MDWRTYRWAAEPAVELASGHTCGTGLAVGQRAGGWVDMHAGWASGTGGRDKLTGKAGTRQAVWRPACRREDGQTDWWAGMLADVRSPLCRWVDGEVTCGRTCKRHGGLVSQQAGGSMGKLADGHVSR